MTAYLVLHDHPLGVGEAGPTITLTAADVADTDRRSRRRESVVPVVAGERLTELQALQALLLPSANNIAAALARWDAGSETRFVARMNAAARSLGMRQTRYTDPSGYDPATVSTAPTRCGSSFERCACRCSRASSPHRRRRCRSPARSTTPTVCSATTGSSASRPARTTLPAAASPSARSAPCTAGARRSPASSWASPAATGSTRGWQPQVPWSHGSPAIAARPRRRHSGLRELCRRAHTQHTGRKPLRKTLLRPAALAVAVALAAVGGGCGGTASGGDNAVVSGGVSSAGDGAGSARARVVKFAECMRRNGISGFPDPDSSGALTIDAVANGASVDTNSRGVQARAGRLQGSRAAGVHGPPADSPGAEGCTPVRAVRSR